MRRTKLHRLMERNGITEPVLSRESGISIRHINNVKKGHGDISRGLMAKLLMAFRRLIGREVQITDLFDFNAPKVAGRQRAARG